MTVQYMRSHIAKKESKLTPEQLQRGDLKLHTTVTLADRVRIEVSEGMVNQSIILSEAQMIDLIECWNTVIKAKYRRDEE